LDSVVWNLKVLSHGTADIKNDGVIGSGIDGLAVSKGHLNWDTSIIWGGDGSDGRSVEPVFDGSAVEGDVVGTSGLGLESASGFLTFSSDGNHAHLLVLPVLIIGTVGSFFSLSLLPKSLDVSPRGGGLSIL